MCILKFNSNRAYLNHNSFALWRFCRHTHTIPTIHMLSSIVLWHTLPFRIACSMGAWDIGFCYAIAIPFGVWQQWCCCLFFLCEFRLHDHVCMCNLVKFCINWEKKERLSLVFILWCLHRSRVRMDVNVDIDEIKSKKPNHRCSWVKQKWSSYHYFIMPSDGLICLYAYYLFWRASRMQW